MRILKTILGLVILASLLTMGSEINQGNWWVQAIACVIMSIAAIIIKFLQNKEV